MNHINTLLASLISALIFALYVNLTASLPPILGLDESIILPGDNANTEITGNGYTEIISPDYYDEISILDNGLFKVGLNEDRMKYGLLNSKGEEVTPVIFNTITDFYDGKAAVFIDGKVGFIDEAGNYITQPSYACDWISGFDGRNVIVNKAGHGSGIIDTNGNEIAPCQYDYIEPSNYSNGLILVGIPDAFSNRKLGVIDSSGSVIIPCEYDYVSVLSESLISISIGEWGEPGFISGVVDIYGNKIVPFGKYDGFSHGGEGMIQVEKDGKIGFLDNSGNEIIKCQYEPLIFEDGEGDSFYFSEGIARVMRRVGDTQLFGYVDIKGNEITPFKYTHAYSFSEGMAVVMTGEWGKSQKYGFIDKNGNEVIPCIYTSASPFSEGLAAVSLNDKYGFIDKFGNEVIPFKYDLLTEAYFSGFNNGVTRVKLDNLGWGLINKQGQEIVPCMYEILSAVYKSSTGYYAVTWKNYKCGVIKLNI